MQTWKQDLVRGVDHRISEQSAFLAVSVSPIALISNHIPPDLGYWYGSHYIERPERQPRSGTWSQCAFINKYKAAITGLSDRLMRLQCQVM